ncbi:hypothetical protein GSI_04404 [Ganoderma sinense ZZ0214-1]|uniref:Uncharacterized protein n=1 Tax=Ganoderma sinense ZZ0214-1 TaxID=1077348 RepID=A0A2G8SJ37_9APHY|nr:hypothetical protein GSI_04404 [Ganoderma sinense ZZ0214-1]
MPHAFLHTARQFYLNMITLGSGGGHNAMEYLAFAEMLHSRTITVPADDSESTTSESAGPHPNPTHPAPAHTAVDSNPASSTVRTTVDSNPASSATAPPSGIPLQALIDSCAIAKAASGFGSAHSDTDNDGAKPVEEEEEESEEEEEGAGGIEGPCSVTMCIFLDVASILNSVLHPTRDAILARSNTVPARA